MRKSPRLSAKERQKREDILKKRLYDKAHQSLRDDQSSARKTSKKRSNQDSTKSKTIDLSELDIDEYRIVNFKPKDGYKRPKKTLQDTISQDKNEIKKRFEGYAKIDPDDYPSIQPNTYIRYLKDAKQYRAGGILVLNMWQKGYWVLKSTDGKGVRWSVPLKSKNIYFRKDPEEIKRIQENKDKLYDAVMNGRFKLISVKDVDENGE